MATQDVAATQAQQVLHNTSYHRPPPEIMDRMDRVRAGVQALAELIHEETEDVDMPRERAMAYTDLESVCQHVIGGLARHHGRGEITGSTA